MHCFLANNRRTRVTAQPCRVRALSLACALAVLTPAPTAAQSGKLEAAYVVLGGEGTVARAILSDTAECPAITLGTLPSPMRVRAKPDGGDRPAFPVLVCEASIPSGTTSAAIEGSAL